MPSTLRAPGPKAPLWLSIAVPFPILFWDRSSSGHAARKIKGHGFTGPAQGLKVHRQIPSVFWI